MTHIARDITALMLAAEALPTEVPEIKRRPDNPEIDDLIAAMLAIAHLKQEKADAAPVEPDFPEHLFSTDGLDITH
ncbi:hypothetical protein [Cucumibacter marinus]|uniref:hypothetical protein n=1 Tax=Cucumibacter marinus TaxID=1121252 RepID=UPI0003FDAE9B|nr:hypothetical protein [Cucumibacter marinus]